MKRYVTIYNIIFSRDHLFQILVSSINFSPTSVEIEETTKLYCEMVTETIRNITYTIFSTTDRILDRFFDDDDDDDEMSVRERGRKKEKKEGGEGNERTGRRIDSRRHAT